MRRSRFLMPTTAESYISDRPYRWLPIVLSAAMGGWLAFYLYGELIDPRNVTWLLYENDPLQHYMGWHFFRRDEWQWPLGAMSNLASEVGTSIVYTDSIPLIALPLKLFHTWLPDPFQYLGLVMLVNLMLNAGIACALLQRCGVSQWAACLGGVLFASLPMATMRGLGAHGHEALSSHWLILLGIWLVLFHAQLRWSAVLRWTGLLAVAVLVHFYLFFMVGVLWGGWWLHAVWVRRAWRQPVDLRCGLFSAFLTPLCVVLLMWVAGYFHYGGDGGAGGGYGVFSAEILTFFNPFSQAWFIEGGNLVSLSYFFPGWETPVAGQYEGQAYAGLGGVGLLLLGGMMISRLGWRDSLQQWPTTLPWLLLLTLGMFVFALSDRVVLGYRVYELNFGHLLWPFSDILRSSGRLAWPLLYVLLVASVVLLSKTWAPKRQTWVMAVLVLLQWGDLHGWHQSVHDRLEARVNETAGGHLPYAVLQAEELNELWSTREQIIALPVENLADLRPYTWLAAKHDMTINVAHLARVTPNTIEQATRAERQRLEVGVVSEDAVYVLTSPAWADTVCRIDNMKCQFFEPITVAWKLASPLNESE